MIKKLCQFFLSSLLCVCCILCAGQATAFPRVNVNEPHHSFYKPYTLDINNRARPKAKQKNKGREKIQAQRARAIDHVRFRQWKSDNLNKLIKNIRNDNLNNKSHLKYLKEGLIAHEGHAAGHTIKNHVGLSNAGLKQRYRNDKSLLNKHGERVTEHVSTFHSLRKAEYFTNKTIEHNMKTPEGRKKMKRFLEGSQNGMITFRHQFTEATGRVFHGPKNKTYDVHGAVIVLRRDPNHVNGWRVHTAMPEKG